MKRFWLGTSLLIFFLALGLVVSVAMDSAHLEIAEDLETASSLVLEESFSQGWALAKKAQSRWQACWSWTAAVADHAPMDEIDGLFAQLTAFEDPEDKVHYAATCAQLAQLVEAMAQAHRLSLENLL